MIVLLYTIAPVYRILAAGPGMPATAVIAERVGYEHIADTLEALGTLRANETVRLTPGVSEIATRIHFEDGQAVTAGDVLVELTSAEESAMLAEAESLEDEAQRQYERIKSLVTQSTASESLLDERQREWRTAVARLEAARSRLQDRLIVAPFSGRVGLRNISPGTLVSPGDIITTLVDDSRMKLDFSIPAIYLNSLRQGSIVEATTPLFPKRKFVGTVSSVDNTIDPVTRSIVVRAIIPNENHDLVPGMLMTLNLLREERDALVISEEAVVPRGEHTFVLVLNMGSEPLIVEERKITLGTRIPGRVEVRTGLAEGETIISQGALKLQPGAVVRIQAIDDGTRSINELIRLRPETTQK